MRTFFIVGVALAACEPIPPDFREVTCGESADATIAMSASGFDPADVTVAYADLVRWDNADTEERTVRSGAPGDDDAGIAFDSGPLGAGASFCVEAREIGGQPFFEIGGATGTLTVEAPPGGGGDDTGGAYGY